MNGLGLVGGVALANAALLACGYGVLSPSLRHLGARLWLTYGGVALLAGAGVVGVELCALAIAGLRTTPALFLVCAVLSAGIGVAIAALRPGAAVRVAALPRSALPPRSPVALVVSTAAGFVLVAVGALALVGGFRSSPWLDDVWTFWVPKGIALDRLGLSSALFLPGHTYVAFDHPDYPWWWSILLGDVIRFVGGVDLRAVDAQLAILLVAFVAALARLLWGYVRPAVLLPSLALLACSPELLDQAQSGAADPVLAIYLVLFALGAAFWLVEGRGFWLLIALLGGSVALQVKTEGMPQLLLFWAIVSAFGFRAGWRRLVSLAVIVAGAFISASPFLIWRHVHDLRNDISYGNAFSPSYLFSRTSRVGPAAETIARHLLTPREWLFLVPFAVAAGLVGYWLSRDPRWLAPGGLVAAGFLFWVWVNWADSDSLSYRLTASSYRIIDATVLAAGASIPVLAEHLLALREGKVGARRLPAPPPGPGAVSGRLAP